MKLPPPPGVSTEHNQTSNSQHKGDLLLWRDNGDGLPLAVPAGTSAGVGFVCFVFKQKRGSLFQDEVVSADGTC